MGGAPTEKAAPAMGVALAKGAVSAEEAAPAVETAPAVLAAPIVGKSMTEGRRYLLSNIHVHVHPYVLLVICPSILTAIL